MKKYILFIHDAYYASGGIFDYHSQHDTFESALVIMLLNMTDDENDRSHIVESANFERRIAFIKDKGQVFIRPNNVDEGYSNEEMVEEFRRELENNNVKRHEDDIKAMQTTALPYTTQEEFDDLLKGSIL